MKFLVSAVFRYFELFSISGEDNDDHRCRVDMQWQPLRQNKVGRVIKYLRNYYFQQRLLNCVELY